nr:TonB-dependent receptor [Bacteroidales bacterium]
MTRYRSLLLGHKSTMVLTLLLCMQGYAISQTVKGRVVDAQTQEPLVGVGVFWSGTDKGTVSATPDGSFSLPLHDRENHLVARIMGYENDTILVHGDTVVTFSLVRGSKRLGRVTIRSRRKNQFTNMASLELTEVITSEGLRGLACCNLGESFENSATVDVGYSDAVSGSKQIQLLGLTGVYSQMLLENTPFLRGIAAPFGLGYVPGQWMESISVSKGVATVKNGYEAITGTINLEYQKPKKDDRFSLNLYENSELRSELTARLSHRF